MAGPQRTSSEDWSADFVDGVAQQAASLVAGGNSSSKVSGSFNSLATNGSTSDFGSDFDEDALDGLSAPRADEGRASIGSASAAKRSPAIQRLASANNSGRPLSVVDIEDFEWGTDDERIPTVVEGVAASGLGAPVIVCPDEVDGVAFERAAKGGRRASQYGSSPLPHSAEPAAALLEEEPDELAGGANAVDGGALRDDDDGEASGSEGGGDEEEDWDAEMGIDTQAARSTLRAMLSPAAAVVGLSDAAPGDATRRAEGEAKPYGALRECERLFSLLVPSDDDLQGSLTPPTPSFELPRLVLVRDPLGDGICAAHRVPPSVAASVGESRPVEAPFRDMEDQCEWTYKLASRIAGDAMATAHLGLSAGGSAQWSGGRDSPAVSRGQSRRNSRVSGAGSARRHGGHNHVGSAIQQQVMQQKEATFERRIGSSARMSAAWVDAHVGYCDHLMVVGQGDRCVAVAQRLVTQVREAASVAVAAGASPASACPEHCRMGALAVLRLVARSWGEGRETQFASLCDAVESIAAGDHSLCDQVALLRAECRVHYDGNTHMADGIDPALSDLAACIHVWSLAVAAGGDAAVRRAETCSEEELSIAAEALADLQLVLHSCSPLTCAPTATRDGAVSGVASALHSGVESASSSRTNSGNHDLSGAQQLHLRASESAGAIGSERARQRKSKVLDAMGSDGVPALLNDGEARVTLLRVFYSRLPLFSAVKAKVAYALAMRAWHDDGDLFASESLFLEAARVCECVLEAASAPAAGTVTPAEVSARLHKAMSGSLASMTSVESAPSPRRASSDAVGDVYARASRLGTLAAWGLSQSLVAEIFSNAIAGLGEVFLARCAYLPAVRSLEASLLAGRRGMTAAQRYARVRWLAGVCFARNDLWRALRLYSRVLRQVRADSRESEATHVALVVADALADVGNHREAEQCLLDALSFLGQQKGAESGAQQQPNSVHETAASAAGGRPSPLRQMVQLRLARLHAEGFDLDGGIAALENWLLSPHAQAPSARTALLKAMLAASYAKKRWLPQTVAMLGPPQFAATDAGDGLQSLSFSGPDQLKHKVVRTRSTSMPQPVLSEGERERATSDPTKGGTVGPPGDADDGHRHTPPHASDGAVPPRLKHSPSFFLAGQDPSTDAPHSPVAPGGVALARVPAAATTGLGYWRMAALSHLRDGSSGMAITCIEHGLWAFSGGTGQSFSAQELAAAAVTVPPTVRAQVEVVRARALARVSSTALLESFPWRPPSLAGLADSDADAAAAGFLSGREFVTRAEVARECLAQYDAALAHFSAAGSIAACCKVRIELAAALLDRAVASVVWGNPTAEMDAGAARNVEGLADARSLPSDVMPVSVDIVERRCREAMDAAGQLSYPLYVVGAYMNMAEVRLLAEENDAARSFFREARDCFMALYGTLPPNEYASPHYAPPGYTERLARVVARLVRLHLGLWRIFGQPGDAPNAPSDPLAADPMLFDAMLRLQAASEVAPRRRAADGRLASPPTSVPSTLSSSGHERTPSTRGTSPDLAQHGGGHSLSAGPSVVNANGLNRPLPSYSTFPPVSRQRAARANAASVFAKEAAGEAAEAESVDAAASTAVEDTRKYSQQTLKVYSRGSGLKAEGSALSAIAQTLGGVRSEEDLLAPKGQRGSKTTQRERVGQCERVADVVFACDTRMRRALKRFAMGELSADDVRRTCREATEDMVSVTAPARRELEEVLLSDAALSEKLERAASSDALTEGDSPSPLSMTVAVLALDSHVVAVGKHVPSGFSARLLSGVDDGRGRADGDGRRPEMHFKSKLSLKRFADAKGKKAATIAGSRDLAGMQNAAQRSRLPPLPPADLEGRLSRELCHYITELVARPKELYGSRRAKLHKQQMQAETGTPEGDAVGEAATRFALSNFCAVAAPWARDVVASLSGRRVVHTESPNSAPAGGEADGVSRAPSQRSRGGSDESAGHKRWSIWSIFGISSGGTASSVSSAGERPIHPHPLLLVCSRTLHAFPWEMVLESDASPPVVRGFSLSSAITSERDRRRRALQYAASPAIRAQQHSEAAGDSEMGGGEPDVAHPGHAGPAGDLRLPEFFAPAYSLESREARKAAERARRGYLLRDVWVRTGVVDNPLGRSRHCLSNRPFQSPLVKSLKSKPRPPKFFRFLDISVVGETPDDLVRGIVFGLGKGCYPVFLCTIADLLEMGDCLNTVLCELSQCAVVAVPSSRMKDFVRMLGKTQDAFARGSRKGVRGALALVKSPYQYLFHVLGEIQRDLQVPIAVFNAP